MCGRHTQNNIKQSIITAGNSWNRLQPPASAVAMVVLGGKIEILECLDVMMEDLEFHMVPTAKDVGYWGLRAVDRQEHLWADCV